MDREAKRVWGGGRGTRSWRAWQWQAEHEAESPGRVEHQTTHPLPASLSPDPSLDFYHLFLETFASAVDTSGVPHLDSNPLYQVCAAIPTCWECWLLTTHSCSLLWTRTKGSCHVQRCTGKHFPHSGPQPTPD